VRENKIMSQSIDKILNDDTLSIKVLKGLVENSFDSVLITDASAMAKIIYANKAFKTLTGHSPADVVGKTPKILQGPATDKKVIARLAASLAKGSSFEGKAVNYKKDGTPFIMYWRVIPAKVGKNTKVWIAIQREGSSI
jgi:PAS domain S-box-containing protein